MSCFSLALSLGEMQHIALLANILNKFINYMLLGMHIADHTHTHTHTHTHSNNACVTCSIKRT